jgi:MoxR-like ATPase
MSENELTLGTSFAKVLDDEWVKTYLKDQMNDKKITEVMEIRAQNREWLHENQHIMSRVPNQYDSYFGPEDNVESAIAYYSAKIPIQLVGAAGTGQQTEFVRNLAALLNAPLFEVRNNQTAQKALQRAPKGMPNIPQPQQQLGAEKYLFDALAGAMKNNGILYIEEWDKISRDFLYWVGSALDRHEFRHYLYSDEKFHASAGFRVFVSRSNEEGRLVYPSFEDHFGFIKHPL